MGRIYGYYEWDDDVGSPGNREDGSLSQNLYNEDRVLAGHARFVPGDEGLDEDDEYSYENTFITSDSRRESEEGDELAKILAGILTLGTIIGVARAAPHVKKWWQEQGRPAVNRQAQKIRKIGRKNQSDVEGDELTDAEQSAVEIDQRQIMSREEAMSRFTAGMAARVYSEEQFRIVSSAYILGVEYYTEIEEAVKQIPRENLQALIRNMVRNPSLLEDESLANLASMLNAANQTLEIAPETLRRDDPDS